MAHATLRSASLSLHLAQQGISPPKGLSMPTIIVVALLSITGLLGTFLYISQSHTTDASVQAAQAEQRCEKARFDLRFDTALTASSPLAEADAQRVKTDCAEAAKLRADSVAASHEQQGTLQKIESAIGNAINGSGK
jgi:uncharacterized membrane protein